MLESNLQKAGLTKRESLVYIGLLKLGVAKTSEIAQKSDVGREDAYYILKILQKKGFVGEVIKSGVKYYNAIDPKRILDIITEQAQQKKSAVTEIMSSLENIQKMALSRPKVQFYEGTEGFKTIASLLIQKKDQIIYCYIPEKILHFLPFFHPQFRRKRVEQNVFFKVITENKKLMNQLRAKDNQELREIRFNNDIIKNLDVALYILSDSIIVLKANEIEQMGIYIEEKNLAELQKRTFDLIWNSNKIK